MGAPRGPRCCAHCRHACTDDAQAFGRALIVHHGRTKAGCVDFARARDFPHFRPLGRLRASTWSALSIPCAASAESMRLVAGRHDICLLAF
eukprot:10600525-Lingulodinium_polyedra.AAC.1